MVAETCGDEGARRARLQTGRAVVRSRQEETAGERVGGRSGPRGAPNATLADADADLVARCDGARDDGVDGRLHLALARQHRAAEPREAREDRAEVERGAA